MATIKLTKSELRSQQLRLAQLQKYLPTLQLKKAMLQAEVMHASLEIERLQKEFDLVKTFAESFASLLSDHTPFDVFESIRIKEVKKTYESIAGVEIPQFEGIDFFPHHYYYYDTAYWYETVILALQNLIITKEKVSIAKEKKRLLEKELREVSIRVNLFEKVMIPRAQENIKKIKVFLGDQQLAAVSQAKIAKRKILARQLAKDASL